MKNSNSKSRGNVAGNHVDASSLSQVLNHFKKVVAHRGNLNSLTSGFLWGLRFFSVLYGALLIVGLLVAALMTNSQLAPVAGFSLMSSFKLAQVFSTSVLQSTYGVAPGISGLVNNYGVIETFTLEVGIFVATTVTILLVLGSAAKVSRIVSGAKKYPVVQGAIATFAISLSAVAFGWVLNALTFRYALDLPLLQAKIWSADDWFSFFVIVAFPGLLATISKTPNGFSAFLEWVKQSLSVFVISLFGLTLAIGFAFFSYKQLDVDFTLVQDPGFCEVLGCGAGGLAPSVVIASALLLILGFPALMFSQLMVLAGISPSAELGGLFGILGSGFSNQWESGANSYLAAALPFSLRATVIIAVIGVALYAGAVATKATRYAPKSPWQLLGMFALVGSIAVQISRMTSITAGVQGTKFINEPLDSLNESLPAWFENDIFSIGIVFNEFLVVLFALLIAATIFVGARGRFVVLPSVFPRISRAVLVQNSGINFQTDSWKTLFLGRAIAFGVAIVIAGAFSLALVERVLVTTFNGPKNLANQYASVISNESTDAYAFFVDEGPEWLPQDALTLARIDSGQIERVMVSDINGGTFQVEETAGFITVFFNHDDERFFTKIPFEGTAIEHAFGFSAAEYETHGIAPTIKVMIPALLQQAGVKTATINGAEVGGGKAFRALPGVYTIEAEGSGLIKETSQIQILTSGDTEITLSLKPQITEKMRSQVSQSLTRMAETCEQFDTGELGNSCFNIDTNSKGKPTKGKAPKEFYSQEIVSGPIVKASSCNEPDEILVAADSFTSTIDCSYTISYEKNYYEAKVTRTPRIVQGTRDYYVAKCEKETWWGYTWWNGCWKQEVYEYQDGWNTSTSRGALIFNSEFEIEKSKSFSVRSTWQGDSRPLTISTVN